MVTLTAQDDAGGEGAATVTVSVEPGPPAAEILEPAPGETEIVNDRLVFSGQGRDPHAAGELPPEAYLWESSNQADPFPQEGPSVAARFSDPGARTLTLTMTTESGSGEASVDVEITAPDADDPTIAFSSPTPGTILAPDGSHQLISSYTTQAIGAISSGFTVDYAGENYDVGFLSNVFFLPDQVLPADCDPQPA